MNQNFANFNAPDVVAEIKRLSTLSGAERDAGYMALDEKIIREYAAWAPILNPVRIELISERVTDFVIHPVYGPDIAAMGIK